MDSVTKQRRDWGSRVVTRYETDDFSREIDLIVIHWGGGTKSEPLPEAGQDQVEFEKKVLQGWQRYHMDTKGWSDIAYNYAVGNSGNVYRLRGWNNSGATSGDYDGDGVPNNSESIAIVWIGGTGGPDPSEPAYKAMGNIIRDVLSKAEDRTEVTPHSVHKATACPGDKWREYVNDEAWVQTPDGEAPNIEDCKSWQVEAWQLAYEAGILTSESRPQDTVVKGDLMEFFRRLELI